MKIIGYKKLSVDNHRYIYDTYTNKLIKVDNVVYKILDRYLKEGQDSVYRTFFSHLSSPSISEAIQFIKDSQEQDKIFQPFLNKDYSRYIDDDFLHEMLLNRLSHLVLEVTQQCNQRCTYCAFSGHYRGQRIHNDTVMTWKIAKQSIDYFLEHARSYKKTIISFYGGEPLLNWKLVKQCIQYIANVNTVPELIMTIGTNLTLCSESMIDFFINNNIELFVSLDGPSSVHDEARVFADGSGTQEIVVRNLERIRKKNPDYYYNNITILCTIDRNKDFFRIYNYFSNEFDDKQSMRINPISGIDTELYNFSETNNKNYNTTLNKMLDLYLDSLRTEGPFNYSLLYRIFPTVFTVLPKRSTGLAPAMTRPNHVCIPGKARLFVNAKGTYYSCDNFCPPGYDIGNYQCGIEIDKVKTLLGKFIEYCEEICKNCWAYRLCTHCFVHTLSSTGHMSKKRKIEACKWEKERIETALKRFIYVWENEPEDVYDNKYSLHARVQYFQSKQSTKKELIRPNTTHRIKIKDLLN